MCEEVGPVTKSKTKISVTSVFDGKQDATDVFVDRVELEPLSNTAFPWYDPDSKEREIQFP